MQFTTITYLLFFLFVYSIYWLLNNHTLKKQFLLFASLLFYASWSVPFLFHFLFVLLINYYLSIWIRSTRSKTSIGLCTTINLLNLGFFKYFYFFLSVFSLFGESFLTVKNSLSFEIILPLAISFYTFQIIAYQIDIYRGVITESISFYEFYLFFMFFPQLIAGPILRAREFLPQFKINTTLNKNFILMGLIFILTGTTKKVLIADNLSVLVDPVWANPSHYNASSFFMAVNGFCWQIYCDFSGYSDIAIGSAYLLGYQIPRNFRAPFLSPSFQELWKNWHTSLSNWLKDYLYVSLGGNKNGTFQMYIYLLITFTLGGLWHGASFTYILWGFLCGVCLVVERVLTNLIGNSYESKPQILEKLLYLPRVLLTYFLFCITVIFFRANSLTLIPEYFNKFFFISEGINSIPYNQILTYIGIGIVLQFFELKKIETFTLTFPSFVLIIIYSILLFFLIGLYSGSGKEFIYFQF
jgi:alginate O-acetyltransferase complex protein AlgI